MIAIILRYWQVGAGAALGALLAAGPVYLYGASQGRQQAAVSAALEASKAYQERAETNDKILFLDAVALCLELGGLPDECTSELRGLAKGAAPTENSGIPRRQ
ncbi:hypothetical protein OSJ77_20075 [Phyllobacterium sp. 0TCS1.6C]|uniref:hypothetical protein n=1 Tax=unclassified Phyllobacterium TaxID=2638441 RepID=UPI0022650EA8|nr:MULTISPECIES: hypothetical protein [unclassified Phyllobacterium]MCX8282493.1 hypothetical protein [Phyllobacterium sp. 0TCS1.6C]MCX8292585.1 hypothetical protein [Phyllobacterium sp. 0TCS1.6A]